MLDRIPHNWECCATLRLANCLKIGFDKAPYWTKINIFLRMKNIATLVRNLPADKYQELAGAVNDVFENKRFNRAQRRRLARNWRKYGKREEK